MHKEQALLYALLSQATYNETPDLSEVEIDELKGWEYLSSTPSFNDEEHKLNVRIYKKSKQLVIAFRGTAEKSDLFADTWIALKQIPTEAKLAVSYVQKVQKKYPQKKPKSFSILLTGHSLGGAIAQYVSGVLDLPAYTFDSPGMHTHKESFKKNRRNKCYNCVTEVNFINTHGSHLDGVIYIANELRNKRYTDHRSKMGLIIKNKAMVTAGLAKIGSSGSHAVVGSGIPEPVLKDGIEKLVSVIVGNSFIKRMGFFHGIKQIVEDLKQDSCQFLYPKNWIPFSELISQILSIEALDFSAVWSEPQKFLSQVASIVLDDDKLEQKIAGITKKITPTGDLGMGAQSDLGAVQASVSALTLTDSQPHVGSSSSSSASDSRPLQDSKGTASSLPQSFTAILAELKDDGFTFLIKRQSAKCLVITLSSDQNLMNVVDDTDVRKRLVHMINKLKEELITLEIETEQRVVKADWKDRSLTITSDSLEILNKIGKFMLDAGARYFPIFAKAERVLIYNASSSASKPLPQEEQLQTFCLTQ